MVDTLVLYTLAPVLGPFYARIFSFLAAVFATWIINRSLAFRHRSSSLNKRAEFVRYFALMLGGGVVNYSVYSALVVYSAWVSQHLVAGVAAGSIAGMAVNYLSSRFLVYRFPSQ